MACYRLRPVWRVKSGKIVFSYTSKAIETLEIPCGQCIGCRLQRASHWAVRCVHESQMHDANCFITLTYGDTIDSWSLVYRDFQLFMKRLRKEKGDGIRFFMCGEYGENNGRPHFHACLFGCEFADRQFFKRSAAGSDVYTSETLSRLWKHGHASVGDVTYKSAAYIARYAMKSQVSGELTSRKSVCEYYVDAETGECWPFVPEFNRMSNGGGKSKKGGLGQSWFEKFRADCGHDYVVIAGKQMKVPKYYDELLLRVDAEQLIHFKVARIRSADSRKDDNTFERLKVKELVAQARLGVHSRSL